MVFFGDSKIVAITAKDALIFPENILSTTSRPSQYLADIRRKYRNYINGNLVNGKTAAKLAIFDIITQIGNDKIIIKILKEEPLENRIQLNELLEKVKLEYTPLNERIEKNKPDISAKSVQDYNRNLKIVMSKLKVQNVNYFVTNPEDVITAIDALPVAIPTKKNYYKSITSIIPASNPVKEIYGNHLVKLSGEEQTIVNKQLQNPDVEYRMPSTLNKITEQLIEDEKIQDAVISIFYSGFYFEPFRLKEVASMHWKNYNPEKDNFIDWASNEFVLNSYKNFKTYGQQRVKFPVFVRRLMMQSIALLDNQDNDLLLLKKNIPFNESKLSKQVSKIFGDSANDLRSMFITYKMNNNEINRQEDKIELSIGMRNSPSIFKNYIKYDKDGMPIKFI